MRKLLLLLALVSVPAFAGEYKLLGVITSTGTSVNNSTTATPFTIPTGAKLTLQGDATFYVLTDSSSVATSGSTRGVKVATDVIFPTSVSTSPLATPLVAVISASGTVNVYVWARIGTE